jgi:membrane protein
MGQRKRVTLTPAGVRYNLLVGIQSAFQLVFRIVKGALLTFSNAKGAEASASLAYYTLFSLFPLILSFVGIGSYLVDRTVVEQELIALLPRIIPVSQDFILANIQVVFAQRGTVSILALLGLIWSSTSVFATLIRNVNSAWPAAAPHSFISMRLASLAIIGALAILLILSSFSITFSNLLSNLGLDMQGLGLSNLLSSTLTTTVIPNVLRVAIFYGLYYLVPQIKVKKRAALIGALFTATLWQGITLGFNAYLGSGMANYEIVYGSLGKIIALLAWIYLNGSIIFFGAHLTSSIDRHTR